MFKFRNLQQKLGFYSFLVSLLALMAVSSLGYQVARSQIQADREQLMEIEAGQIVQQFQDELNNTAREIQIIGELGIMQAGLGRPQTGEAAAFLDDLREHQPKYDLIFTVDSENRIASVNSLGASASGKRMQDVLPELAGSWLQEVIEEGNVKGTLRTQVAFVNQIHGREPTNLPDESLFQFAIAAPIAPHAGGTRNPGAVVAIVNWKTYQAILDGAEERFRGLDLPTGYAFLFANDANTVIAHKYKNLYGTRVVEDHNLPQLRERMLDDPTGTYPYEWVEGRKIAALGNIQSVLGPPFNWYLGVGINEPDIFRPVQEIFSWFLAIPLIIAVSVLGITTVLARKMSVSLTEFAQLARDAAQGRFSQLARARTDDELGELAQAFNEMLVSFRAQMPFTAIPNPYVVGNPIRRTEMFFGRQDDLEWIGQQLDHAGNKMILLFGPRRIGKTSLLHQIYAGRCKANIVAFFFDTQQIIPEIEQDSDFYHVMTREMLSQLPVVMPGVRAPFIAAERFTPETFRKLLRFIRDSEPEKRPVLLFDELENLEFKLARGALSSDLLLFLASLLDGDIPVGFVATGSDQLERLNYPGWQILRAKTIPRRIGLLLPDDAQRLILEPVRGYVLYDEGIPEQILRATAGHPYYTQVVCQTMVDYLNQKRDFAVGPAQLSEIFDQVLQNPPPPLNHVWDSFSHHEKLASAILAYALKDAAQYADLQVIRENVPLELQKHVPDLGTLINACDHLCRDDWMERDLSGKCRFRVDLLRMWISRDHSIWQVTDELRRSAAR
jgi:HAMP domain-containing protein